MKKLFLFIVLPCFLLGLGPNHPQKLALVSFPWKPSLEVLKELKKEEMVLTFFSHDARVDLSSCDEQTISIVSANYYFPKKENIANYYIDQCHGIKIGFFALLPFSKESKSLKLPNHFACEKVLKEFKKKGVELIVLYSHLSLEEDQKLMKKFPEIDCVFGWHSRPIAFGYQESTFFYKAENTKKEIFYKIDLIVDQKSVKNLKIYPTCKTISFHQTQD